MRTLVSFVRSVADSVSSAGSALNGTWNSAYAVAQRANVIATYSASGSGVPNPGWANIAANRIATPMPPMSRKRRRLGRGDRVRAQGLGRAVQPDRGPAVRRRPDQDRQPAGTAIVSVRYFTSTSPGTVPK